MSGLRLAGALLAGMALGAAAQSPELPAGSVYRLPLPLTDQSGVRASLDRYRGQPVLVSMFYASCPHVCPTLISAIRRMELELPEAQRARVRVLLVSLDPDRDTPEKLAELAQRHRADLSRWTFARADEAGVRKLAALLDIRYRRLPDGEFNHSTVVTLLDGEGRMVAATSAILKLDPQFLEALRATTR